MHCAARDAGDDAGHPQGVLRRLDGLLAYYAGLATDQARRDGAARGPVDYYLDRNEPPGRWRGGGCAVLGVGGEVRAEQMEALLTRHPATGKRLGRGFGDRSARAFDATFSAPKSVSVLWALSPDAFVRPRSWPPTTPPPRPPSTGSSATVR